MLSWSVMRGLKALRGLSSLASSTLIEGIETAARTLTTVPDLKSVLKEKIPEQQVCCRGSNAGLLHSGIPRTRHVAKQKE